MHWTLCKRSVGVEIGFLYSQLLTNSHSHFPIIVGFVTSQVFLPWPEWKVHSSEVCRETVVTTCVTSMHCVYELTCEVLKDDAL